MICRGVANVKKNKNSANPNIAGCLFQTHKVLVLPFVLFKATIFRNKIVM